MEQQEKEIVLIKRDVDCHSKKIDELKTDFKDRIPANETLSFINKTNLEMQKQSDNLAALTKTLDTHVEDQKKQDSEIKRDLESFHTVILNKMDSFIDSNDKRVVNLENWKSWVIGIFSVIGIVMALIVYIYLNDIGSIKIQLKEHVNQSIINK